MTKQKSGKQVRQRLYECDDCHTRRFVAWVELNRAAKPKCYGCGSTRLELVSDDARDDAARLQCERLEGNGGSLILGASKRAGHRAVMGGGCEHNKE